MTKVERIASLLESVEGDVRKETIREILETLADFAKDGVAESEKPGMRAAIEIIRENCR